MNVVMFSPVQGIEKHQVEKRSLYADPTPQQAKVTAQFVDQFFAGYLRENRFKTVLCNTENAVDNDEWDELRDTQQIHPVSTSKGVFYTNDVDAFLKMMGEYNPEQEDSEDDEAEESSEPKKKGLETA